VELIILGSGTSVPSLERGSAGYLVQCGETLALVDSGPGTLLRILQAGFKLDQITHILYSHTHVDHTADLVPLLFTSKNPTAPRTRPLTIAGSADFLEHFSAVAKLYGNWISATRYQLTLTELGVQSRTLGALEISTCPVAHIPSSLALRLEGADGRSLVYSGDTDECEELVELARGCDVLLIEASTPDELKIPGHLTPSLVGRIAAEARPGKVVLTHFYPSCEGSDMLGQLKRVYAGEAVMARDQMRISI
jgi:ribonuclease BN (tRNA processing enzyme)